MNDREIIELFLRRDRSAVEEASKAYGESCRSVAMRILNDPGGAEECVNDALMRAWGSIPPADPANLSAYLARLTRNAALNRLKLARRVKRGRGAAELALDELSGVVSGAFDPEAELIRKELANSIESFLLALPEEQRRIFVERYWHFKSVEEISALTGFKPSAIYTILSRTRARMKNYLLKEGYEV